MRQLRINKSITNRTEESLDKYLADISRIPMINADEEVSLAQSIRAGGKRGEAAKHRLITANLRFVVSVAKQYQNQGVPLPDLINEGNIGLMAAAERFDETRGFKFISYAIWWVRQSILQSLADDSNTVRRPMSQIAISNKIKNATNTFLHQHQRYPSAEELSELISVEIRQIEKTLSGESYITSIDAPLSIDAEQTFADTLASSSDFASDVKMNRESLHIDVLQVLESVLNERERVIILQSFGIGCSERPLEDIGHDFGLSRERVRQIRERGLEKVRKSDKARFLLRHLC